jgi:hypothetical protein
MEDKIRWVGHSGTHFHNIDVDRQHWMFMRETARFHLHIPTRNGNALASRSGEPEVDLSAQKQGWEATSRQRAGGLNPALGPRKPALGYGKIEGELIKLDFKVSQTTHTQYTRPPQPPTVSGS